MLPFLVSSKQSAWVKGRSIHDTITILQGVIKLASVDAKYKDAAILFLDLVKAFDTVAWRVIFDFVLPGFGFPPKFINLIRALYAGAGSKILVNGFLSELFGIVCGVRQGDSASPPLFALFVELFSLAFQCVPGALSLPGPLGFPVNVEMYADNFHIVTSLAGLPAAQEVCDLFIQSTGMSFGEAGSTVVFVPGREGAELSAAHRGTITALGLRVLDGADRHKDLGMLIGHGVGEAELLARALDKMTAAKARFAPFHLDILARVMVLKVFMLSYLNFTAAVVDWDDALLGAVWEFMLSWVWANKTERLNELACMAPTRDGGLGLFDLRVTLRARRLALVLRATRGGPMADRMGQFVLTELFGARVACFHGVQALLSEGVLSSVLSTLPVRAANAPRGQLLRALSLLVARAVHRPARLPLGAVQAQSEPSPRLAAAGFTVDEAAAVPVFDNWLVTRSPSHRPFTSPALQVPGALMAKFAAKHHASVLAEVGVRLLGDMVFQNARAGHPLFLSFSPNIMASRFFPLGSAAAALWLPDLSRVAQLRKLEDGVLAGLVVAVAAPRPTPAVGEFFVETGLAAQYGGRPAAVSLAERVQAGRSGEDDGLFDGVPAVYKVLAVSVNAAGAAPAAREPRVFLALYMVMADCVVVEVPLGVGEAALTPVRLELFQQRFRLALVTPDFRYAGVVAEGAALGRSIGLPFRAAGGAAGAVTTKAFFELSSRQLYTAMTNPPGFVRGSSPHRHESWWHYVWAARPGDPAVSANWHVPQPKFWPASVRLRGKDSVFHMLHAPGLLDAYQRELLLWVFLNRVWTNERCHSKLKKGHPGCLVCGAAEETLRHLIWDCPVARAAWKTVIHLFADLRGLPRPRLDDAASWNSARFVVSVLASTPEYPVVAQAASRKQQLIWLVLKAEVLSCIWRLRCSLIQDGQGPPVVVAPYSGAEVLRRVQVAVRQRVIEERYLPTDGLVFEDWLGGGGALAKVEAAAMGGVITFSSLLGGVCRRIAECEDPAAPDHLFKGLPLIR